MTASALESTPTRAGAGRGRSLRLSWIVLLVVTGVAALSAAFVALTPAEGQTELSGRTWAEFAAQDPEVAALVSRQLMNLGLIAAAFALLAAVVVVVPYRRGDRWAWWALWLVPLTFAAIAGRMLVDAYGVGYYYALLAAVALAGLLSGRARRPRSGSGDP